MGDAEIGSYFHLTPEVIDIIESGMSVDLPKQHITGNLHDSSMFSAAVKKSGSRACVNPGVSAPIVSTPIVSTTITPLATLPRPQVTTSGALSASALRSAPISGYIADDDTASALRSAPISGYIADDDTACKHGFTPECTFCWNERRRLNNQCTVDTAEPYLPDEMVEFESAKQDTITITISRADASLLLEQMESDFEIGTTEAALAFEAALEGER